MPPDEWQVCDSVRWRAGPRAQYCSAFAEIGLQDGTLSYLERMEVPGDIVTSRPQLFVRDAYNGRTLRTEEPAGKEPNWYCARGGRHPHVQGQVDRADRHAEIRQ